MDEAVRTTASPAAIWAIVIVMSILTAVLVSAAAVADSWQARAQRRARRFGVLLTGAAVPAPRSMPQAMSEPVPGAVSEAVPATPPDGRPPGRYRQSASELAAAEAPTLPDLPPVPGQHAMPAQREADFDQPAGRRPEGRRPEDG